MTAGVASSNLTAVVLKVASRCNLNCQYCYVYNHEDQRWRDRPHFISDEVFDATLRAIGEYCERRAPHSMFIAFHGGEPTLIGSRRFDELASRAEAALGEKLAALMLQTNATLLDEGWIDVLAAHRVALGVSLDGPPQVHDATRVTHGGRGSHAETVGGIRLIQSHGVSPTVLCVITPGADGLEVYRHFRALGIDRMDFLLPDCSHDTKERWYGGLGSTPVADFLIPIFDAWVAEDDPAVVVRVLWGLLQKMMDGEAETDQFGNAETTYLVVETDGSIEALDALRVCDDGLGVSGLNVLDAGFDDLDRGSSRLLHQATHEGFPLCAQCRACPEVEVCGGGYLPHRYSRRRGFDNPSVWCEDILALTRHMRGWLADREVAAAAK